MEQLIDICSKHTIPSMGTDKNTTHSYIEVYTKEFDKYREYGNILEIGAAHGMSLRMWREYFTNGIVAGIDNIIEENLRPLLIDPNYKVVIQNATDESIVQQFTNIKFDIIIDDGSHQIHDQLKSFDIFKELMNVGGIYIIEDVVDVDNTKDLFLSKHHNCEIIDHRHIKNRFDDVLAIYRF